MGQVRDNARRAADRRGNSVTSVTACAAPERGRSVAQIVWRVGAACAAGRGPRAWIHGWPATSS